MAIGTNNIRLLNDFKKSMQSSFDISLFGDLKTLPGWRITRTKLGIKINQEQYAKNLINTHNMEHEKPALTPLAELSDLLKRKKTNSDSKSENAQHRAIVGGLLYLAKSTGPGIVFTVVSLARLVHEPAQRHLKQTKRILRYI